jgi:shikimate dehydrogenase
VSISAVTRVFAVLGDPVAHSRSPQIHNAANAALGIDAVYTALRCDEREVAGLIRGLALAGGGGNVTLPHKGLAADAVDKASARVRATRACNTFRAQRGKVYGENTDVEGFSRAVREVLPELAGTRALILGSGGGARAVLYALLEERADAVTVLGRKRSRAREMEAVAGRKRNRVSFTTNARALRDEGFDLIVNTTSLGLKERDRLPLKFSQVAALTAAFDIVYRPGGTEWVRIARANGIPAADGSEMLIQQAAAAFELWFEQPAPVPVMRRALFA